MRLLDDSINQKDPIKLYKVGNVIKNGESTYFVIVKDSNRVLHKDNKFGLVLLENGRLQYHGGDLYGDSQGNASWCDICGREFVDREFNGN